MRKCTKHWTCKDGTKVRICDMTHSHLTNTIAMLERVAKKHRDETLPLAYSAAATLQGEMASYYADQEICAIEEDEDGERFLPDIYWDLVRDHERRQQLQTR